MSSFFRFPHTPHIAWLAAGAPRDDKVLSPEEAQALLAGEQRLLTYLQIPTADEPPIGDRAGTVEILLCRGDQGALAGDLGLQLLDFCDQTRALCGELGSLGLC